MQEVTQLTSVKPNLATDHSATPTAFCLLTTAAFLPQESRHMEVHTILIVIVFCVVCLLLLLAFFYAFCFHFSIGSSQKDSNTGNECSLDPEDATYKHSSSDNQSVGNVIWLDREKKLQMDSVPLPHIDLVLILACIKGKQGDHTDNCYRFKSLK